VKLRGPRSLRGRLIWGIAALAVAAVLGAQVVGVLVLHTWLLNRVDEQLIGFPAHAEMLPPPPAGTVATLPSDFRVVVYDAQGRRGDTIGHGAIAGPDLPDDAAGLPGQREKPVTVPAVSGDGNWRISVRAVASGDTLVVCLPLDTVDGATDKMLWYDAILLLIALGAVAGFGYVVVGVGLRPLNRMQRRAGDITARDLSRRIEDTNPHTEIGRLGIVLNTMLDRLDAAMQQTRASEERLRRFVADAGHELRTPLTTIQGFAQLAMRTPEWDAAERREADRVIAQDAERMSLLIDDLLLLASLDREPAYRDDRVDLAGLAADAIRSAAPHGDGRTLHLTGLDGGDPGAAETWGDARRLHQVITNLLTNALRHTRPGTQVDVRVGATEVGPAAGADVPGRFSPLPPLPPGSAAFVVEVADHGPGLHPGDAARVFERFYRVDTARSRDRGGSGLGLAIAVTIARGHGGRLEVDTGPERGAVFRLVLPAQRAAANAPRAR